MYSQREVRMVRCRQQTIKIMILLLKTVVGQYDKGIPRVVPSFIVELNWFWFIG